MGMPDLKTVERHWETEIPNTGAKDFAVSSGLTEGINPGKILVSGRSSLGL